MSEELGKIKPINETKPVRSPQQRPQGHHAKSKFLASSPKTSYRMNQSAILIAAALAVAVGGGYIIGNNTAGAGSDNIAGGGSTNTQQSSARIMGPRANRASSRA
ncbi:MAG: hypothetical protein QNL39_01830, partial [Akkermansiaceae bacterium]